ncbi:MAG: NPCBM/NEW2 domain-containing protein [Limisphaerales bacterium]
MPNALALDATDIPADAPQDALMAGPAEIQEMQDWASAAFTGRRSPGREPAVRVELRRQDYNSLGFGQSCMETPIKLGQREFKHGLGTHANSEIVLHLPPDAKEFKAFVGIDNNFDTGGVRGSVQFSAEIAGKEVFRTQTLRGTNAPAPVKIALLDGTRELTLKVDTTPDGPSFDQADWADACIVTTNGTVCWADEDRQPFTGTATPFSFRYGGAASATFLGQWRRDAETKDTPTRTVQEVSWTDPNTSLRLSATVAAFKRYPAVEWVLQFENLGPQDTPLLQDVQALDVQLRTGYSRKPVQLQHLVGDVCGERSFLPLETEVEPGKTVALAPEGGRSSNGAFPFFNVQYGDEGLITAIGWSGQWRTTLERSSAGPTALRAGMEKLALRLHPGERIRTPRILVMPWKGDRFVAHNRFRRLMLFEYAPRQNGRPLQLPVALQCFDRYVGTQPDWGTEAAQLRVAKAASNAGCDAHWLDAAWFEGGFPNGVGNWFCPPQRFPNGLKPLSDACHQLGLKFILWFEPERVASGTQIAREHPEFVFGGDKGGLFKLSDPAARRWLADLLSRRITEFGIDTYRNDFNLDPLGFWREADAPDRQGITEIRYVEGHYALWDELLAGHPGLHIDNCASGGRRIDLETCRRSVPLWHSDTGCSPGHADWNQTQISGLSLYVPLFGACAWTPEPYDLRSAATAGVICQFPVLDAKFSFPAARAALAEVKENEKYWYGDFYPLTPCILGPNALIAWQLHRSDLNAGIVLAFRHSECPYPVLQASLRGLNPRASYVVNVFEEGRANQQRTLTGRQLMNDFELRLSNRGSSLLVRYKQATNASLSPK